MRLLLALEAVKLTARAVDERQLHQARLGTKVGASVVRTVADILVLNAIVYADLPAV